MGGDGAAVEQNLKMTKWWGRNNINKVSEFLENWNCTPSLSPGVIKNHCVLFRKKLPLFILKITNQVKAKITSYKPWFL